MIVPLAGICSVAYVYLTTIMTGYSAYPLGFSRDWLLAPVLAAIAAGAALFWISRSASRVERFKRYLPAILVTVAIAAAGYAWFFRDMAGKTAVHDAAAFRTFGTYYLSPAGLFAALAGLAYVTMRRFWLTPALLSTICVFASFFLQDPDRSRTFLDGAAVSSRDPARSAAVRDRVRVLDPGQLVRRRSLAGAAVGLVFVLLLGRSFARVAAPVRHHIEYTGMIPRLEALSQKFRDNDLVVVESRDASDIHVLALPLAYIYGRTCSCSPTRCRTRPRSAPFSIGRTHDMSASCFSAAEERICCRRCGACSRLRVTSSGLGVRNYAMAHLPAPRARKEFDYGIYVIGAAAPADEGGFDLDVGFRDDLHTVRFHAKEQTEGQRSAGPGEPPMAVAHVSTTSRVITLWMSDGGRPPSATAATVSVYLEDRLLGTHHRLDWIPALPVFDPA